MQLGITFKDSTINAPPYHTQVGMFLLPLLHKGTHWMEKFDAERVLYLWKRIKQLCLWLCQQC
jgi:hypothetical protein